MFHRALALPRLVIGAALLGLAGAPALAQDESPDFPRDVPPEAERLLWCGSAFHMLAIGSEDDADTQNFLAARVLLTERAAELLFEADYPEDQLPLLAESYDERVAADFESGGDLPFSADACLDALDIEGL